jgi:trimeric autotransporter adhesin
LSAASNLAYRKQANDCSAFEVDAHQYEYTMTLTGVLHLNGMPAVNDHYTVGAYINGVCRGFSPAAYQPNLKGNRIFLTIYGEAADAGEIIEFRIFDGNTGESWVADNKGVAFLTDKIVGQALNPYVLNYNNPSLEKGYYLSQNRPNPLMATTTIDYTIPRDGPVELILYDNVGRPVSVLVNENKAAGNYSVVLKATSLASGMYSYRLKAGDYVKARKLVIVR